MSTISSVSSQPVVQNANNSKQNAPAHRAHGGRRKEDFEAAAKAAGADPSKLSTIESQVQDALKSAKASGGSDSRKAAEDAIDTVLKNNGVDAAKFKAAIQAQRAQHAQDGEAKAQPAASAPTGNSSAIDTLA